MKKNLFGKDLRLGILGGGQLGRMFIQEAVNYNIAVHILENDHNAPSASLACPFTKGDIQNFDDVMAFGKDMDVYGSKISYPNDGDIPGKEITDNFLNIGAIGPNYGPGMIASFSNYGKETVDIFSPGQKIYAAVPFSKYKFLQGTSMASPNVAGVAGLIRSRFPNLTASEVKHIIMNSGLSPHIMVIKPQEYDYDGNPELAPFSSLSKSGNMVNVYNAILLAKEISEKKLNEEK